MAKRSTVKAGPGGIAEEEGVETPPREDPDAALMSGGPGGQQQQKQEDDDTPKTVKIMVGGKEVEVDEGTVQILRDQEDFYNQEILKVRRAADDRPAPRAADPKPDAPKDPFDELDEAELFSDPRGTLRKVANIAKDQVRQELTGQYEQAESQKAFWSGFYADNKELKKHDNIVRQTLASNMQRLAPMKAEDAGKELARLSRETLLSIARDFSPGGEEQKEDVILEGTRPTTGKGKVESEAPRTLTGLIKSRRAARRAGASASQ